MAKTKTKTKTIMATMKTSMLQPSGWNPRMDFGGEEMQQLSESLKTHGVLQPIVVRPTGPGKKCEIVAGERRWLAARLAKLAEVPVVVRDLSDREAKELTVTENLQREDLNAIDEARGFAMLLQGDDAPTQTQLGERLGCSQAHVANRLRLLKLPQNWRQRIISGEIPASHAREVLAYVQYPAVLKEIEKLVDESIKRDGPGCLGNTRVFVDEFVEWGIGCSTRRLGGQVYVSGFGNAPPFRPNREQEKQLRIIETPARGTGKKNTSTRRASNVKLFDRLQSEHVKRWKAAQEKKGKAGGKAKAGGNGKTTYHAKPVPLSPAAEKERAAQFKRRLWEVKIDWTRCAIADTLRNCENDKDDLLVILLWFAARRPGFGRLDPCDVVNRKLRAAGLQAGSNFARNVMSYPAVVKDTDCGLLGLVCGAVADWFASEKDGPLPYVPAEAVLEIAERLMIDLSKEWSQGRAGDLTEVYFKLHDKAQLGELAAASKVKLSAEDRKTKGSIVAAMMAKESMPYPKELDKAKRP